MSFSTYGICKQWSLRRVRTFVKSHQSLHFMQGWEVDEGSEQNLDI